MKKVPASNSRKLFKMNMSNFDRAKEYIKSVTIDKCNNDLYHSYDNIDEYLVNKYKLNKNF